MEQPESREPISPERLERLRRELIDAFERIRQHLTWAEAMLVLSRRRAPESTNSHPRDGSGDGVAA
jgi:hypothetical protein